MYANAVRRQSEQQISQSRFQTKIATSDAEIAECMQLRYQVFAEEMGASLQNATQGIDEDKYDSYCEHLIVRNAESGKIVATTRLLVNEFAEMAGGYYSQSEFEMENILGLNARLLEVGRTCVAKEHRADSVINHLWQGVAAYLAHCDADYLMGCVSLPLESGAEYLAALMEYIRLVHMSPEHLRVTPKNSLNLKPSPDEKIKLVLPSLLKRYLNIGAKVCGDPNEDKDFNVADLFILLDQNDIHPRYKRHFLRQR